MRKGYLIMYVLKLVIITEMKAEEHKTIGEW
jgi:hypothetical protein